MEALWTWLQAHGVSGAVVAFLIVAWKQVGPILIQMISERVAQIQEERTRELLLALVRAAEQIFGAQDDAQDDDERTELGARKLGFVLREAENAPAPVTIRTVEAAVHQAKAKELKTDFKAISGEAICLEEPGA
jgi:hypothetical protein